MWEFLYHKLRRKTGITEYLPVVDGLRFLAISMVFLHHCYGLYQHVLHGPNKLPYVFDLLYNNGYKGVHLFFVISGFILAIPFAKRILQKATPVSIPDYYKRRIYRLEPPYFIAMTVYFLLIYLNPFSMFRTLLPHVYETSGFRELLPHYIYSILYCHNNVYDAMSIINGVAWTLEIELRFYLIAPLIFQLFRLPLMVRRTCILAAIILIIVCQQYFTIPAFSLLNYAQYFLAGILLADIYLAGLPSFLKNNFTIIAAVAAFVLIWLIPASPYDATRYYLVAPIFILFAIILGNPLLSRLFALRWFTVIGGMCYSIYLWHYLVMWIVAHFTIHWQLFDGYLANLPLQILLFAVAVLIACSGLYLLVEKPFMALQHVQKRRIGLK